METLVRKTGDMVRVLEIKADASDLETDVRLALKKQKSMAELRGFRPGRVPVKMIRRVYAKEVENIVVGDLIQEVYEDMIEGNDEYQVFGSPDIIHQNYRLDQDLEVQIEFFVAPEIELKDLSGQVLEVPAGEVTDDVIEFFIKKRMAAHLKPRPLNNMERIGRGREGALDRVTYELVEVDRNTGRVLIGRDTEAAVRVFDYSHFRYSGIDEYSEYAEAFMGCVVGDEVLIDKIDADGDTSSIQVKLQELDYRVKILEAHRFDFPEINDEWASKITKNEVRSAKILYNWIQAEITEEFERINQEILKTYLIERMLDLHPFSIPPALSNKFSDEEMDVSPSIFVGKNDKAKLINRQLCWELLFRGIRGQLGEGFSEKSTYPTSSEENIDLLEEKIIGQLLEMFEIRHIPLSAWDMFALMAEHDPESPER